MHKHPLVSIIVVNFNGEKFISSCMDSLLKITYPNYEIVLVENGSKDNSLQHIKHEYGNIKKVKIIISKKNLFFTGGSNLGAKKARGKYVVFLNNDTEVNRNWISELVAFIRNKRKALVQPKIYIHNSAKSIDSVGGIYTFFGLGFGKGGNKRDYGQYDKELSVDFVNGTSFMIEKKFFLQLGGFDNWYKYHYEDVDLCLRAKKREGKCYFCPSSIIYHKISLTFKGNVDNSSFKISVRKNSMQTVIKNFKGFDRLCRLMILASIYLIISINDLLMLKTANLKITMAAIKKVYFHNRHYRWARLAK